MPKKDVSKKILKFLLRRDSMIVTFVLTIFLAFLVVWVRNDFPLRTRSTSLVNVKGLIQAGDYSEALEILNHEIDTNEKNLEAILLRGDLYSKLRRFDQAIDDYTRYLDRSDEPEILIKRCNAFRMKALYNRAIEDCRTALEISPDSSNASLNLALIYMDKGEYTFTEYELDNAISKDPSNPEAYFALFQVYGSQGNLVEAMDALNSCISVDPENIPCYWERGQLRLANADVTGAVSDFQEILERGNPKTDGQYMFKAGSQLRFIDN